MKINTSILWLLTDHYGKSFWQFVILLFIVSWLNWSQQFINTLQAINIFRLFDDTTSAAKLDDTKK